KRRRQQFHSTLCFLLKSTDISTSPLAHESKQQQHCKLKSSAQQRQALMRRFQSGPSDSFCRLFVDIWNSLRDRCLQLVLLFTRLLFPLAIVGANFGAVPVI